MDIKILVAYHKKSVLLENDIYLPIQVNKELSKVELFIQGDNTGDNISKYNSIFCEMTAVYWAWKNLNADYIGLCHYRRIFSNIPKYSTRLTFSQLINLFKGAMSRNISVRQVQHTDKKEFVADAYSFGQSLQKLLDMGSCEIVAPSPHVFYHCDVLNLFETLHRDNISMIKEIVESKYPQMYSFLTRTLYGKRLFAANMFVMKKAIFDEYCSFVFDVLFTHISTVKEKNWCNDPSSEGCFARVSGYMAEILTSAFIEKKISEGVKVKKVCTAFLQNKD